MPAGRPRLELTPELEDEICARITNGESVRSICADENMPCTTTVMKWLRENEAFAQRYARAKDEQAEGYADEIVQIADTDADPQRARVRIDARKWVAAKLLPKKYGERSTVAHEGGDKPIGVTGDGITDIDLARRIAFILSNASKEGE